jgi:hypothetical protein
MMKTTLHYQARQSVASRTAAGKRMKNVNERAKRYFDDSRKAEPA